MLPALPFPTPFLTVCQRWRPALLAVCCLTAMPLVATPLAAQAAASPAQPPVVRAGVTVHPADVAFLQGMIAHHRQALDMSALIGTRSQDSVMRLLGERITVSQRDEIAIMANWLRVRGQTVPAAANAATHEGMAHGDMAHGDMAHGDMQHEAMDHAMPGMLSPAQMDSLRVARGVRFDRLFLRYMIQHHEGALVMVKDLLATSGAAQEPQLFGFVSDVDTDQRAEIRRMQALLTRKPAPAARPAR